jgi:hypothetical protein
MTTTAERDRPLMQCTSTLPPCCCTSSAGRQTVRRDGGQGTAATRRPDGASLMHSCGETKNSSILAWHRQVGTIALAASRPITHLRNCSIRQAAAGWQ